MRHRFLALEVPNIFCPLKVGIKLFLLNLTVCFGEALVGDVRTRWDVSLAFYWLCASASRASLCLRPAAQFAAEICLYLPTFKDPSFLPRLLVPATD